MSLESTPLSIREKLDFLPAIFYILSTACYTSAIALFRDSKAPRSFKNHVILSTSRAAFSRLSSRQVKHISGTTEANYLSWTKKHKVEQETTVLKDGTKVFWIGKSTAKTIALYFHGGGFTLPPGNSHFNLLFSTVEKAKAKGKSISFAIVQYNLTPSSQFPTQISQGVEALDYMATTLGKHSSEIILAGDSAGAILLMGVISHILHPHPGIKPINLSSQLKGIVLLSPWVDFEMTSPSALENSLQDPVFSSVLRTWVAAYLGEAPLDNYNQPGIAPAEWWRRIPVKQILITGGAKEVFVEEIARFAEKLKSVNEATEIFLAPDEFHGQPVVGPELGISEGEQAGVFREWFLRQLE